MYSLLIQTALAAPAQLTIKNNCDFEIKPFFDGGDAMPAIPAGQSTSAGQLTAPIKGSRMYFGPSDFIDKSDAAQKEYLGFLEFNAAGEAINLNPSMINYVGLPMVFEKLKGGNVVEQTGCTSANYQGLASFQSHIQNYCPGTMKKLDSETELYYCSSTYSKNIDGTKIDSDWDVAATISSSTLFPQSTCSASKLGDGDAAKINIGNCQPADCLFFGKGHATCAEMNRGSSEDHDPSTFYSKPSPYDPTKDVKWQFNPYAAFVHLICGPTIFAFPTDDTGAHGGYISAGSGEEAVITICPAAGSGANSPGVLPPSSLSNPANGSSDSTATTTASATSSSAEATTQASTSSETSSASSTTASPSESESEAPSSTSSTTVSPTDSGSDSSSTSSTTVSPSESESEASSSTSSTTVSPTDSGSASSSTVSPLDSTAALHI
jgi:hypothetical protein